MHTYRVELAKRPTLGGFVSRWVVTDNYVPLYRINKWLDNKTEANTSKRYAYALISFLKFLDTTGITYLEVNSTSYIEGYVKYLLHYNHGNNITQYNPKRSFNTVRNSLSIIASFYRWLENEFPQFSFEFIDKLYSNSINGQSLKRKYLYGQIWNNSLTLKIKSEFRFKDKRNYRKWYTRDIIDVICSNFKTIRDKVIFLISVEGGCRIDEILNIKYSDYDSYERKIYISKSKTFERDVYLPLYVCEEIDRYINTERQQVEVIKGILEPLFINLNKGKYQGTQVKYLNYYTILKNCANRAGMRSEEIITHAGRSTRAQSLVEHQVLHPEDGITDSIIQEIMGWSNIDSIQPYKKQFNPEIMKKTLMKIEERKREK
jgi:integrase